LKVIVSLIIALFVIALAAFITIWVLKGFILGALAGIAAILFLIFVSGVVLYAIRITLEEDEDDVDVITHFNKDTGEEITDIRLQHPWWR
jgi:hypothetical protein